MGEKKSYLAGAGMAVLFGTSFLASKTALRFFDQPMILAWRFFLAAVILMLLGRLGIVSIKLKGKPWYHLLGVSIVYPVLSYTFEMKGVDLVPSSQAGVIVSLMPVFILIFGRLFLGERPKMIQYHVWELGEYCMDQIEAIGGTVITHRDPGRRAGIIIARLYDDVELDRKIMRELHSRKVFVAQRFTDNVGGFRISCQWYNLKEDIDVMIAAMKDIIALIGREPDYKG